MTNDYLIDGLAILAAYQFFVMVRVLLSTAYSGRQKAFQVVARIRLA